jgi:hypothetical protein
MLRSVRIRRATFLATLALETRADLRQDPRMRILLLSSLSMVIWAGAALAGESVPPPPAPIWTYLAPADVPKLALPPKHYTPPDGFAGHAWGDLRTSFDKLPQEPAAVRGAWTRGFLAPLELVCTGKSVEQCTVTDFLRAERSRMRDGDGFHLLSEYLIESQGYKFPGTGVVLHPVVYQFCANWHSMRNKVPKNFDELNKFCGMRMLFDTESTAELRALPGDHVTRYDLVLAELMARFGKPANFSWRGRVTIESVDGPASFLPSDDRRFSTWRWCPAPRDGLMTRCDASIVLSIDPDVGRGIVLFSTPALWEYAYARESGSGSPDPLYTLMHALSFKHRAEQAKRKEASLKAKETKQEPAKVEDQQPAGTGGTLSSTGNASP